MLDTKVIAMTVPALVGLLRPSAKNRSGDFVIMVYTRGFIRSEWTKEAAQRCSIDQQNDIWYHLISDNQQERFSNLLALYIDQKIFFF